MAKSRARSGGKAKIMKLFAKKPIDVLLAQANEDGEHTLKDRKSTRLNSSHS